MRHVICAFALSLGLFTVDISNADDVVHPWIVPAPRLEKTAYFSNLADGATIETPFLLKFGLSGMGLAPFVKRVPGTGHHHLLVNRELPLDFSQPLPFNDQYIHFGKGQMETVLNFDPGRYTLRLVLADERHIPNFVYGKPTTVTVTKRHSDIDPKSVVVRNVAILQPAAGANVRGPFRVSMHVSGLNVSNTELSEPGTGHFRLRVKPDVGREEVLAITNGFTEIWLKPPTGAYTARVEFIDNTTPDKVLLTSPSVSFHVVN